MVGEPAGTGPLRRGNHRVSPSRLCPAGALQARGAPLAGVGRTGPPGPRLLGVSGATCPAAEKSRVWTWVWRPRGSAGGECLLAGAPCRRARPPRSPSARGEWPEGECRLPVLPATVTELDVPTEERRPALGTPGWAAGPVRCLTSGGLPTPEGSFGGSWLPLRPGRPSGSGWACRSRRRALGLDKDRTCVPSAGAEAGAPVWAGLPLVTPRVCPRHVRTRSLLPHWLSGGLHVTDNGDSARTRARRGSWALRREREREWRPAPRPGGPRAHGGDRAGPRGEGATPVALHGLVLESQKSALDPKLTFLLVTASV